MDYDKVAFNVFVCLSGWKWQHIERFLKINVWCRNFRLNTNIVDGCGKTVHFHGKLYILVDKLFNFSEEKIDNFCFP